MQQILIDTSAWVALNDSTDKYHVQSVALLSSLIGHYQLAVTNYILDETYTLLLVNVGYKATVDFHSDITKMIASKILHVIWIDQKLADDAWSVFEQFNSDKARSFTDCVSYAAMKQNNITEAFSFDHHFAQMGFIKLPA